MKKKFYFERIRRSVTEENVIVIQGYSNEAYMDVSSAQAVFKNGKTTEVLNAEIMTKRLSPIFAIYRSGAVLRYMTFIYVRLNDNLIHWVEKASGDMNIFVDDSDASRINIFGCKLSFIKKRLNRIDYIVDSVNKNEGELTIKGWVADPDEVRIGLYKVQNKKAVKLASEVEWAIRSDALEFLPEGGDDLKCGFTVKAFTREDKLKLNIQTRTKRKLVDINAIEDSSKSGLVRRIGMLWQTVDYNLNTIGFSATMGKVVRKITRSINKANEIDYNKWRLDVIPDEAALERQKEMSAQFKVRPKFSIVVPMYESDETLLKELIDSLKNQTYDNFELCLSDGSSDKSRLCKIVEKLSGGDDRIRYIAEKDKSSGKEVFSRNTLGIAENTNQAMAMATGDYIVFGDHDDLFAPNALYECARLINEKAEEGIPVEALYTDEDKVDKSGKSFSMPNFKPDFNLDFLRSINYICHMFVISKRLADAVGEIDPKFNGAQDYDYILRCVDKLDEWNKEEEKREGESLGKEIGAEDNCHRELESSYGKYRMYHIPKALYHWRMIEASTAADPKAKVYAFDAGKKAVEAHLKRRGLSARVDMGDELGYYDVHYEIPRESNKPMLSIIIPNKDHIDDLKTVMESIDKNSVLKSYEYIIVENNSTDDATFEYYKELEKREDVKVLYWKDEFNYSLINNFGAAEARGDYLLLLNNDIEMINGDALSDMLGFCQREDVGAVGARLYYKDGTIQHAGVVMGFGGIAGHCFTQQAEVAGAIYYNRSKMSCDYSAETAACLMVKKPVFDAVGGLNGEFKVAFNDIDFCMRIRSQGLLIVYDAWARFYHYESKSRGLEDTPEKKERFKGEVLLLQQKWGEILQKGDPYYNPNLSLERQDFSLRL